MRMEHRLLLVSFVLWQQNVLVVEARHFLFDDLDIDSTASKINDDQNEKPNYFKRVMEISQNYKSPNNYTKLVRHRRQVKRNYIVKCCGQQSCHEASQETVERRHESKRKEQEQVELISDLQYKRPKKGKRKKKQDADLANLRAYGVFTDSGIHISCAGCPAGWPDMLTVYPEYEIGISVSCSNCPQNWPGALNLLGVGGDPAWAQDTGNNFNGGRRRPQGNGFVNFDSDSNFGSDRGAGGGLPLPPLQYDNDYPEASSEAPQIFFTTAVRPETKILNISQDDSTDSTSEATNESQNPASDDATETTIAPEDEVEEE